MTTNDRLCDLRILVVDDDKDTREMLRFILQQAGGHVSAASSVAEAFQSYQSSPPDVIVADIGMPEYNGYALIALIRAHDKEVGGNAGGHDRLSRNHTVKIVGTGLLPHQYNFRAFAR